METDTDTAAVESAAWPLRVRHAHDDDVADIVALNNMFAPDGLTLHRSEAFVVSHLQDYQVVRGADGKWRFHRRTAHTEAPLFKRD